MQKQIIARGATTLVVLLAAIGFAAPSVAATEPPWAMPDVRNMVLQKAVDTVFDVTGEVELDLRLIDRRNNQDVLNLTNWLVCAQSPSAGREISQKTMRVVLYVKRFNQRGCS